MPTQIDWWWLPGPPKMWDSVISVMTVWHRTGGGTWARSLLAMHHVIISRLASDNTASILKGILTPIISPVQWTFPYIILNKGLSVILERNLELVFSSKATRTKRGCSLTVNLPFRKSFCQEERDLKICSFGSTSRNETQVQLYMEKSEERLMQALRGYAHVQRKCLP